MAGTSTKVFFYEPAKIMYVLTHKCGSTTLFDLFRQIANVPADAGRIRSTVKDALADGALKDLGLSLSYAGNNDALVALRESRPDYTLMANIRDPYSRFLSNYSDKLSRYAKRFERGTYYKAKLAAIARRPWRIPEGELARAHLENRISIGQFIDGLERHGIDVDSHYNQQSLILALDRLKYDHLIKLETFNDVIMDKLREVGVSEEALGRLESVPKRNSSSSKSKKALLTPEIKERIVRLYQKDFDMLGYPR